MEAAGDINASKGVPCLVSRCKALELDNKSEEHLTSTEKAMEEEEEEEEEEDEYDPVEGSFWLHPPPFDWIDAPEQDKEISRGIWKRGEAKYNELVSRRKESMDAGDDRDIQFLFGEPFDLEVSLYRHWSALECAMKKRKAVFP